MGIGVEEMAHEKKIVKVCKKCIEENRTGNLTMKDLVYIGEQRGLGKSLSLYNCKHCGDTHVIK